VSDCVAVLGLSAAMFPIDGFVPISVDDARQRALSGRYIMTSISASRTRALEEEVIRHATRFGFSLVQSESDTGQLVWTWRRPRGAAPSFLTRRDAVRWMRDSIARDDVHE